MSVQPRVKRLSGASWLRGLTWVVVAAVFGSEGNQHYAPERREQHDAHHRQRNRYLPEQRWAESASALRNILRRHGWASSSSSKRSRGAWDAPARARLSAITLLHSSSPLSRGGGRPKQIDDRPVAPAAPTLLFEHQSSHRKDFQLQAPPAHRPWSGVPTMAPRGRTRPPLQSLASPWSAARRTILMRPFPRCPNSSSY